MFSLKAGNSNASIANAEGDAEEPLVDKSTEMEDDSLELVYDNNQPKITHFFCPPKVCDKKQPTITNFLERKKSKHKMNEEAAIELEFTTNPLLDTWEGESRILYLYFDFIRDYSYLIKCLSLIFFDVNNI